MFVGSYKVAARGRLTNRCIASTTRCVSTASRSVRSVPRNRSLAVPQTALQPRASIIQHIPTRQFSVSVLKKYAFTGPKGDSTSGAAFQQRARKVLRAIIGINVGVYLVWQYSIYANDEKTFQMLLNHAVLSEENLEAGRYHTLLTSAFSHNRFVHLLFNMVTLDCFGSICCVAAGFGGLHVVGAVCTSAIVGSLLQLQFFRKTTMQRPQALGASGAVMGMGALAAGLLPLYPVNLFLLPVDIPVVFVVAGYGLLDAFYRDSQTSNIGHWAHLGGLAGGLGYWVLLFRRRPGSFIARRPNPSTMRRK